MRTTGAAQAQPAELEDALEVGEQHLNALALATRLVKGRRVVEGPGDIAGILMDIARNLAVWGLGAASLFERTRFAVVLAGPVEQRAAVMHLACGLERLAPRAEIEAALAIPGEVGPGEGAVLSR